MKKLELTKIKDKMNEVSLPKIGKKQMTEEDVLKKLEIPDWRHMSKDKIMKFTSTLRYMDPEVAMETLKKFPDYANMCGDVLKNMEKAMDDVLGHASETSKEIIQACKSQMEILQVELQKDNLTVEEKLSINKEIMNILDKMESIKDKDHDLAIKLFNKLLGLGVGVLALGAAVIGVNINNND